MRIPALPALLKQLAASPRPVRAFSAEKGRISLEFEPTVKVAPKEAAEPQHRVEFVPGTDVPVGDSPLNPLDTLLNVPKYDANEVS